MPHEAKKSAEPVNSRPWSQQRRLEFIDSRLRWDTRINRKQLIDAFGISSQQASADLALYTSHAPGNLVYDRNEKAYRASVQFVPIFDEVGADDVLAQLQGMGNGLASANGHLLGWQPPIAVVTFPQRRINDETLREVVSAIRLRRQLRVTYQSMRREEATQRWIAPHALGFDGTRWHARAWCFEWQAFRDFVLTRIFSIDDTRPSDVSPDDDTRWNALTTVVLRPKQQLSASQRDAVAVEFGMEDGQLVVPMREAMVYYFVRQLRLDISGTGLTREIPLEWVNKEELMPLIREATA